MGYNNDDDSFYNQDRKLSRFELRFDPTINVFCPIDEFMNTGNAF